jgi:hypothetical protein
MGPEAVLLPGRTVAVFQAHECGDRQRARALQKDLFVLAPVVTTKCAPPCLVRCTVMAAQDHKVALPLRPDYPQARMKAALNHLGICTPTCTRCPVPPLSPLDAHSVSHAMRRVRGM